MTLQALHCPLHGPVDYDDGSPFCLECDHDPRGPRWWAHNLVAHPLLVLWPRVGRWLHDRTEPPDRPEFVLGPPTHEQLLWQAREALRITREYVYPAVHLPARPGWAWWDATVTIDRSLGLTEDDILTLEAPQ